MIKLIASDLDGTLLQNGALVPSDYSLHLIEKLMKKGIRFVAASGRQYQNLKRIFGPLSDKISYVAENGALAIHEENVLLRGVISPELTASIIAELKKRDDFEILLSREDACYIEGKNPEFVAHIRDELKNTCVVVDDISTVEGPILKIALCSMNEGHHIIDKYLKHLQDMFDSQIRVVTSGNIWIDFIAPNTNKGIALQRLLDEFHIKPEECMAFGDQYNDVEMLQLVGTSYAMANAAPGISYYSTYVTNSVDDVLEDVLEGFV
ncbi:MAG: HAD family hydrolase [Hespellia sp.]|nr:HAD family hydrolase [Hespellia sp.]